MELKTVRIYDDPLQARLDGNMLETLGIQAFIFDESSAQTFGTLGLPFGRVKLQVAKEIYDDALELLNGASDASSVEAEFAIPGASPDEELPLTEREQDTDRAFRGAVAGLLFLPIQVYVSWLILKVLFQDQSLGPRYRWKLKVAAAINIPIIVMMVISARLIMEQLFR